jgi:hypothetical protein
VLGGRETASREKSMLSSQGEKERKRSMCISEREGERKENKIKDIYCIGSQVHTQEKEKREK